jgi:beta-lactamase regulating signal transducer with metallopeptidase domain
VSWLAANLAWSSALMLLVLAVRRPFARAFGAGPAYALWLLPLLRLLLPPVAMPEAMALLPPVDFVVETGAAATTAAPAFAWTAALAALWIAGAAAFLGWQFLAYRAFLARLSAGARGLGRHAGLALVESAAVDGPLALGLLDRRIVVPADFDERYSPAERRLALDHEAVHHRRGDIWWNLAALAMLALNWFNPLAWLAFRAFREDQELACDAAVAARAAAAERHDYACALVKSATRPGLVAVCPLNRADQLKRRLRMINTHSGSRARRLAGAAAVLALAGAGLTLGSAGAAHPHPEGDEQRREHRIIVMEKAGDGDHSAHREGAVRQFTLRRGEDGEVELPENCRDGGELVNVDERDGDNRTRFILCGHGDDDSPAGRAAMLETARERVAASERLNEEQRARILAGLDAEIARLRAQ